MSAKPRIPRTPKYRRHKATRRAFVEFEGQRFYLGKHGSPESHQRYHQKVAEWIANGKRLAVPPSECTVVDLCAAYLDFAEKHYGPEAKEMSNVKRALSVLRQSYGRIRVAEFGVLQLKAIRQTLLDGRSEKKDTNGEKYESPRLCRATVNRTINTIRRVFKWGAAEGMTPADIWNSLRTLEGLRAGRSDARESEPVRPVPVAHVEAAKAHVSRQVAALIDLQLLTGARPGELLKLRPLDFDTKGGVWTVKLARHKTAYKGRERVIYFGPKAQAIVRRFMAERAIDAFLFSPREAEAERRSRIHELRVTPLSCGNSPGTNKKARPEVEPGEHYTPDSYRKAIERGCVAAEVPVWTPHRLRHNAATSLRKEFGLEVAQVVLGHAHADVTQIYAEADREKALAVIAQVG